MALVAYDYESNSEEENDEEQNTESSCIIIKNKPVVKDTTTKSEPQYTSEQSSIKDLSIQQSENSNVSTIQYHTSNLFSNLPQTKTFLKVVEEDQIEDFIPKSKPVKERQKVKITIPSLSQFSDDDEPQMKKIKSSSKGSGLMSLLPPVKGSVTTAKSFIPNVLNKPKMNSDRSTSNTNLIPNVLRKKSDKKKTVKKLEKKARTSLSDVDSDDDIELPDTFDDDMWEKVCGRPKPKQTFIEPVEESQETIDIAPEPEKPYDGLDNKAFKELVGKTKRPIGNIKLIDINEEQIMPDKDLWMTKSLTDPEMAPKVTVEDPVDPTRRKKHHITYLAQQAKANEQELQSAWSASKNNRMASRAKYGF